MNIVPLLLTTGTLGAPGAGGGAVPTLPAGYSVRWSAADLGLSNGAAVTSWVDSVASVEGAQGTAAAQPSYAASVAAAGNKPGVVFGGNDWLTIATPGIVKTTIDTRTYSVVIVASGVQAASYGCLFGSSAGGNSQFYVANGSVAGRFDGGLVNLAAPWASSGLLTLGSTSTTTNLWATSGPGVERSYMQGGCVASGVLPAPVSSGTGGSFAIGAISSAGTYPVKATIHEIIIWPTELTPAEMLAAQAWVAYEYGQTAPWEAAGALLTLDGDSITSGTGGGGITGSYPYKMAQTLGLSYGQWTMLGIGGLSLANMDDKWAYETAGIRDVIGSSLPIVNAAFEYYNAHVAGLSAATILTHAAAYHTAVKATGNLTNVFGTSTGHSGDPDGKRPTYDSGIAANAGGIYGDTIVSLHTDTSIGDYTSYATNSATYWSDGVHLKAAGYTILAGLMEPDVAAALP